VVVTASIVVFALWSFIHAKVAGDALTAACATAKASLDEGEAKDALDTFEEATITEETAWRLPTACARTRSDAEDAADDPSADTAARNAEVALVCSLATADLERGDPARALATLNSANLKEGELAKGCGATATIAEELTAAGLDAASLPSVVVPLSTPPASGEQANDDSDTPSKAPPARVGTWWDEFTKGYTSPIATVLTWLLGGALALFVLARLLVELPGLRSLRTARSDRRVFGWLGWVLLLVAPLLLTATGIMVAAGVVSGDTLAGLFVATAGLGLVASVALAAWLASLLRISISVVTPDGLKLDRAQVMERVRILTGDRGGSIEIPGSADVTDLGTSLSAMSDKEWVAAVQRVLLFLVGVVPWNAAVDVKGDRRASVVVARNRRTLSARRVITEGAGMRALEDLPKPLTEVDVLATFVAAEILMSIRPWYALDFAKGIYGATDADSVALQHIAVTWFMRKPHSPQAEELLATATRRDPFNRLAQASLMNARHRQSSDVATLMGYRGWVDAELGLGHSSEHKSQPADKLERGLLVTRAAITRNLAALLLAKKPAVATASESPTAAPMEVVEAVGWPPGRRGAWTFARTAAASAREEHLQAQQAAKIAEAAKAAETKETAAAARQQNIDEAARKARTAAGRARSHAETARLAAERAYSRSDPHTAWLFARAADAAHKDTTKNADDAAAAKDDVLKLVAGARLDADRTTHRATVLIGVRTLLARLANEEELLDAQIARNTAKGDEQVSDQIARIRLVIQQKALVAMLLNEAGLPDPIRRGLLNRQATMQSTLADDLTQGNDSAVVRRVPALAYGFACYLTRWVGKEFDDELVAGLLDTAIALDAYAAFAKHDPELSTAGDAAGFGRLVIKAATALEARAPRAAATQAIVPAAKLG
jgi:hypothetical protein